MTEIHSAIASLVSQYERASESEPRYRSELRDAAEVYRLHLEKMRETKTAIDAVVVALEIEAPDLPPMPGAEALATVPDPLDEHVEPEDREDDGVPEWLVGDIPPPPDSEPTPEPEANPYSLANKTKGEVEKTFRSWWLEPAHRDLTWTAGEISKETGWDQAVVRRLLKQFERTGMLAVDRRRQPRYHQSGRKAEAFKYVDPKSIKGPTSRPRGEISPQAVAGSVRVARGAPVSLADTLRQAEPAVQRLMAQVRKQGFAVTTDASNHIKVVGNDKVATCSNKERHLDDTRQKLVAIGVQL